MTGDRRVAGLVLAAGAGTRIGTPKALLRLDGQPLVSRAAAVLAEAGCDPVVVVLGAAADQVTASTDLTGTVLITNPAWQTGMASSLKAGLTALAHPDLPGSAAADTADTASTAGMAGAAGIATGDTAGAVGSKPVAVVVMLVDLPGITAEAVRRLVAVAEPDGLAVATYSGRFGHPVLLGRRHWTEVAAIAEGDEGARRYLRAHADAVRQVPCDDVADPADVDTFAAAQAWRITLPDRHSDGRGD